MNLHEDSNTKMVLSTWNEVNDMNHTTQNIKIETKKNLNRILDKFKLILEANIPQIIMMESKADSTTANLCQQQIYIRWRGCNSAR